MVGFIFCINNMFMGTVFCPLVKKATTEASPQGCFCGYILHEDDLIVGNKSLNDCWILTVL